MADLDKILQKIDEINTEDPNSEFDGDKQWPKELIYGRRMTEMLHDYLSEPSVALQIAARGQHIKRWAIARDLYPMDRKGYLKWRTELKLMHADLLADIMVEEGFDTETIERVKVLVTKKKLKVDEESKVLEDVVCLVFLKFYFGDFAAKHPEEKVIDILKKTWTKMTGKGHEKALNLPFNESDKQIILKALN